MSEAAVRIAVPRELANELLKAELVRADFRMRGGPVAEALELVVETVDTAANVVTVLSAPVLARELVERIRAFFRRKGEPRPRITIEGENGREVVDLDDERALERLNELVASALAATRQKQPD